MNLLEYMVQHSGELPKKLIIHHSVNDYYLHEYTPKEYNLITVVNPDKGIYSIAVRYKAFSEEKGKRERAWSWTSIIETEVVI